MAHGNATSDPVLLQAPRSAPQRSPCIPKVAVPLERLLARSSVARPHPPHFKTLTRPAATLSRPTGEGTGRESNAADPESSFVLWGGAAVADFLRELTKY